MASFKKHNYPSNTFWYLSLRLEFKFTFNHFALIKGLSVASRPADQTAALVRKYV